MAFCFCISDCSGTGSNDSGLHASTIMTNLAGAYPSNGGAISGLSSMTLEHLGRCQGAILLVIYLSSTGCSSEPKILQAHHPPQLFSQLGLPYLLRILNQDPQPSDVCRTRLSRMNIMGLLNTMCAWGEVEPEFLNRMANGALFDEGIQNWN